MDEKFHLKVVSREGVIYEGDPSSITSFNEKGKFDILASHTNFISLVKKGITIRLTPALNPNPGEIKEIAFENALMRVKSNNVELYLGIDGINSKI